MKNKLSVNNSEQRTDILNSKRKDTSGSYTDEKLFQSLRFEFSKLDAAQQKEFEAYIQSIIDGN